MKKNEGKSTREITFGHMLESQKQKEMMFGHMPEKQNKDDLSKVDTKNIILHLH